jgi:hypothetical protein
MVQIQQSNILQRSREKGDILNENEAIPDQGRRGEQVSIPCIQDVPV